MKQVLITIESASWNQPVQVSYEESIGRDPCVIAPLYACCINSHNVADNDFAVKKSLYMTFL